MSMIGTRIGHYQVIRKLGEGGFGTVYEAIHEQIEKRAAIKTLHAQFSEKKDIAQRFLNEARAVNIVKHPGIVNVFEFGQLDDGTAYIIMEFLDGITLSARLKDPAGLSLAESIRLTRQVASAVTAAHDKGIVHRDLKPDNVMIVPDADMPGGQRIKVLDFGIAKLTQDTAPREAHLKTRTGATIGTPAYMSPEQCRGEREVDEKSDVYSLGVMLYQMLCGRRPFESAGVGAVIAMHIYESPRPLREQAPSVPAPLATLVHAMMAKKPKGRPTMNEVAADLLRLADVATSRRLLMGRERKLALVGGSAVALALVATLWRWHGGYRTAPVGTASSRLTSVPVPASPVDPRRAPPPVRVPVIAPATIPDVQPGPSGKKGHKKLVKKEPSNKPGAPVSTAAAADTAPPPEKPAAPVVEKAAPPPVAEKPKAEPAAPRQDAAPKRNDTTGFKPFF